VFSVAYGGLGMTMRTLPRGVAVGQCAVSVLDLDYHRVRLALAVAWTSVDHKGVGRIGLRIHPLVEHSAAILEYQSWVEQQYEALRAASLIAGRNLTECNLASTPELQKALHYQEKNGGHLLDALCRVRHARLLAPR